MNNDFMVSAMNIRYSNTRRSKVKNNMKQLMVLVSVCFLTLSFAKEQTPKVSLEIQKDIQKKQLIEQLRYFQNNIRIKRVVFHSEIICS